jgi:hypothetical protein
MKALSFWKVIMKIPRNINDDSGDEKLRIIFQVLSTLDVIKSIWNYYQTTQLKILHWIIHEFWQSKNGPICSLIRPRPFKIFLMMTSSCLRTPSWWRNMWTAPYLNSGHIIKLKNLNHHQENMLYKKIVTW